MLSRLLFVFDFYDLIRHASSPKTLAYGLYEIADREGPVIDQIDVEKHKDEDVITPKVGSDLTAPGRPTKQYQEITL